MKNLFLVLGLFFTLSSCEQPQTYQIGKIDTRLGEVYIWLHEGTPTHKQSFIDLANQGYWDSLTFNRVIPNFVAQGGCPDTEEGFGDSPYLLEPEFVDSLTHIYGAVGAGRDDNPGKLSAACQFYIVQNKDGVHRLDGDYTIFGQVIKGMDIIDAIVAVDRDAGNKPMENIKLNVKVVEMTAEELKELEINISHLAANEN